MTISHLPRKRETLLSFRADANVGPAHQGHALGFPDSSTYLLSNRQRVRPSIARSGTDLLLMTSG